MNIPDADAWGEKDSEDLPLVWAYNEFFGKSFSEAKALFSSNALNYQEDLEAMPTEPLNFYAPALAEYITSESARNDDLGASSFLRMVEWLHVSRPEALHPTISTLLLEAALVVAERQDFYGADRKIFGDFSAYILRLKELGANVA